MNVEQLIQKCEQLKIVCAGDLERTIDKVYCGDLLSIVMGHAPENCAWVTVMGNVNSIAVAVLSDMACVIIAENSAIDDAALDKAKLQNVTVLRTELPVFETAFAIHNFISS